MNLLILMADQLRADYLSCYGHPSIATTNIDLLASEGVRLDRAYCSAPLCGPSRISFVTSTRFSEHSRRDYGSCIDYRVPNLVSSLKAGGYRTGMFGKNHCFSYGQLPTIWDEYDEICLGNYDNHPSYKRSFDAFTLEPEHEYNITMRLAEEAMGFMEGNPKDKPFLCWVNWQDPHPAFTCPEPYASLFSPSDMAPPASARTFDREPRRMANWRANSQMDECSEDDMKKAMAMYMGQVRYVDDAVGAICSFLKDKGLWDDTLILFMSDHGELLGDRCAFHKLPVFYEPLVRIPVILRHPAKMGVRPGVVSGLVEAVDLAPTILDALSLEAPPTMVGESLHCAMKSGHDWGRESVLVEAGLQRPTPAGPSGTKMKAPFAPTSHGPGAMVTDGQWKLSVYHDDSCELYDLRQDPHELDNLFDAAGNPSAMEAQNRLTLLLARRILGVGVRQCAGPWPTDLSDPAYNPLECQDALR